MQKMQGKKLLVISSDSSDIAFVKAAHEMGCYVIACDRYEDWSLSPAKTIADEAWNIDYKDTENIILQCKLHDVDGVIAGYNEEKVLAASRISSAINSPFYATEEQIQETRDKLKFRKLCARYGINTPKAYSSASVMDNISGVEIDYPVIVKPVDSYGRKGISICDNQDELSAAIDLALSHSDKKEIIIEEYLDGIELSAVYTLADGDISLSCLNDKYIARHEAGRSKLCNLVLTPSTCYTEYLKDIDPNIKKLLRGIAARDGVANFQFVANEKGIKAIEMGYRVNGNDDFKVIRKYNDIDFMKMLVSHSLTGSMGDSLEKDNPQFPMYNAGLILHLHGGTIASISYSELLENPAIDDISLKKKVGSKIVENGTNQQKAMMIKMSAETMSELTDLILYVQSVVKIKNTAGENMLLPPFDINRLRSRYNL